MSKEQIRKQLDELGQRRLCLMLDFSDNKQCNKLFEALRLAEDKKDFKNWQKIHNKISALERKLSVNRIPELAEVNEKITELKSKL